MRACIVFVHDDPDFAEPAVAALRAEIGVKRCGASTATWNCGARRAATI